MKRQHQERHLRGLELGGSWEGGACRARGLGTAGTTSWLWALERLSNDKFATCIYFLAMPLSHSLTLSVPQCPHL